MAHLHQGWYQSSRSDQVTSTGLVPTVIWPPYIVTNLFVVPPTTHWSYITTHPGVNGVNMLQMFHHPVYYKYNTILPSFLFANFMIHASYMGIYTTCHTSKYDRNRYCSLRQYEVKELERCSHHVQHKGKYLYE